MIRLIAAIDRKRGIGKNGFQPWLIPDDDQYFTDMTQTHGATILVGSTTFKLFNSPLVGRTNYVLSRDKTPIEGVELVDNLEKFLKDYQSKDLWVIGGANLYSQVMALGKADELYITNIQADFGCTQFFPSYDEGFVLKEQSELHEQNGFIFSYSVYTKAQ